MYVIRERGQSGCVSYFLKFLCVTTVYHLMSYKAMQYLVPTIATVSVYDVDDHTPIMCNHTQLKGAPLALE